MWDPDSGATPELIETDTILRLHLFLIYLVLVKVKPL
jgi:hypothetical protein